MVHILAVHVQNVIDAYTQFAVFLTDTLPQCICIRSDFYIKCQFCSKGQISWVKAKDGDQALCVKRLTAGSPGV